MLSGQILTDAHPNPANLSPSYLLSCFCHVYTCSAHKNRVGLQGPALTEFKKYWSSKDRDAVPEKLLIVRFGCMMGRLQRHVYANMGVRRVYR